MSFNWRKKGAFLLAAVLMLDGGIFVPDSILVKETFAQDFSESNEAVYPGDDALVYDESAEAEEAGEIPYVMPSMEEMEAWIVQKYGKTGSGTSETSSGMLFSEDPAEQAVSDDSWFFVEEEAAVADQILTQPTGDGIIADFDESGLVSENLFSDAETVPKDMQNPEIQGDSLFSADENAESSLQSETEAIAGLETEVSVQLQDENQTVPADENQIIFTDENQILWDDGDLPVIEDPESRPAPQDLFQSSSDSDILPDSVEDILLIPEQPEPSADILTMVVADDGSTDSPGINPSGHYTLEVLSGDDITIPLNYLIQSVKDTATDDHPVTIVIPAGSYDLTGTISLYSNMTLIAEGATITKKNPVKQIIMRLGIDDVETEGGYNGFRNVVIDGGTWDLNYNVISEAVRQEAGGYVGFRLGHVTNLTVQNVHFRNNLKSHFLELAGAKDVLVTGCSFSGYWESYTKGGQECIQLDACLDYIFPHYLPFDGTACEHVIIENNTFSHVFAGIGAHSMVFGVPYHDIQIRNNTFADVRKRAIWCMNFTDSVVENNHMNDVGGGVDVDSGHSTNVHVLPGTAPSSPHTLHTNLVIQNNQIEPGERRTLVNYTGAVDTWNPYGIRITGFKYTAADQVHEAGKFPVADVTARSNHISGAAGGILLSMAENCTVSNNTLDLFYPDEFKNHGISISAGTNNTLSGNQVSDTKGNGIYLYGASSGNVVESNKVERSGGCGICLASSSGNNRILSNTLQDNASDGIQIGSCNNVTLQKNNLVSNGRHGLYLNSAKSCSVSGGKAVNNQGRGISLNKSSSNIISQVTIQGNVTGGIGLYTFSASNRLTGNTVTGNGGDGIVLSSSNSNTLTSNNASKNKRYGIYLYQSKSLTLASNKADSNTSAGIFASGSKLAAFQKNTAYSNKTYGIAGSSSSFSKVSANKTYANGKAAQIYMKSCSGMATMNKPVSSKVTAATTVFKGKAVGAVKIFIYRQNGSTNTKLISGKVSKNTYSLKGKKQKKGTKLLLLAKDKYGNESRALYTVK